MERWRRIVLEASQQARRAFLPVVHEPARFRDALAMEAPHRYVLDEKPGTPRLNRSVSESEPVAILIGPEGGWTDEERNGFTVAGWTPISLGPLILRAETAAIAALAIFSSLH